MGRGGVYCPGLRVWAGRPPGFEHVRAPRKEALMKVVSILLLLLVLLAACATTNDGGGDYPRVSCGGSYRVRGIIGNGK